MQKTYLKREHGPEKTYLSTRDHGHENMQKIYLSTRDHGHENMQKTYLKH